MGTGTVVTWCQHRLSSLPVSTTWLGFQRYSQCILMDTPSRAILELQRRQHRFEGIKANTDTKDPSASAARVSRQRKT